ncbi:gfo/Idh/MocA family oxidoreductase [bacterium]|nr:gfo/Idh/MocA family oxidoreductase [bacterium]
MHTTNRRRMMQITSLAPLVLSSTASHPSPNDKIHHAVIGLGNQGQRHCREFHSQPDLCQVVAVCDVDPKRRQKAAQLANISSPKHMHEDYRQLLADASIDSVSITTPDHWHAKIALEAMLAGKHVYVEKPCCHNIEEGRLLIQCAKQEKKCVQHGTQSRSGSGIQQAMEFLQSGKLGPIRLAKAINHQRRGPIGKARAEAPPAGVNYDIWLGPAPRHAFTRNRWHYNWHWFWDYGTGDIGNDGIHQIDVARWGLNVTQPHRVTGSGGQLFYEDDHQTPDTQTIVYEYDHCHLVYEMRLWTDYKLEGHDNGTVFYGEEGRLEVGRDGCHVYWKNGEKEKIGGGSDLTENIRNFLSCIKANQPQSLNAPITEGFYSAALSHLGNITTRVQNHLQLDSSNYAIVNDSSAQALLGREYRQGYELPRIG